MTGTKRRMLGLLLLIMVLFHWKILLTHQFSLLTGGEATNQAYAWYNFAAGQVKQGSLPLWDPYTQSGRSFPGEMQTGAFYPANLLLALVPFNHNGEFSPQLYHWIYALTHVLGAWFMACLALEMGLGWFAALVAGLCYSLTGIVGRVPDWPHMFHSAIWLPLIVLFLLRALKAAKIRTALLNAALCGGCLGMSALAGGLHLVMMQAIVIMTLPAYYCWRAGRESGERAKSWAGRAALLILTAAGVGILAGAVQLLPSVEYGRLSIRWAGDALPSTEKIPYAYIGNNGFWPHALLMLVIAFAYNVKLGPGEIIDPYVGVFPMVLVAAAIWKYRDNVWVRYAAGLGVAAFVYSMGAMSLLHGISYALVPFLWMAREADRFMYLAEFAIAVLAGFGVEALLTAVPQPAWWGTLTRWVKWAALAAGAALLVPAIYGKPELTQWVSLSLVLVIVSYFLLQYVIHRPAGPWMRFLVLSVILFDLYAFDFSAANKAELADKHGTDELERLLSCRKVAAFLKSQPGAYRAEVIAGSRAPNIGNLFGVEMSDGAGVTMLEDYDRFRAHIDLLSVRYKVRPASSQETGTVVYQDPAWKVYENPNAYPRAWLVHDVVVERDSQRLFKRLDDPQIDLHRTALVSEPLEVKLDPPGADSLDLSRYNGNRLELGVEAGSRGLLVLSEIFYPGWKATVNGQPARIWKVNGALRGIIVPPGKSRVALHYAPLSVYLGGALSLAAFVGVLAAAWLLRRTREAERGAATAAAL